MPLAATPADGRVVVAGGLPRPIELRRGFDPKEAVEIYDALTDAWTSGPELDDAPALGAMLAT